MVLRIVLRINELDTPSSLKHVSGWGENSSYCGSMGGAMLYYDITSNLVNDAIKTQDLEAIENVHRSWAQVCKTLEHLQWRKCKLLH